MLRQIYKQLHHASFWKARFLTTSSSSSSAAARRLRSPVTWFSAAATLTGLYGMYEYQKFKQMTKQRSAGRPDLGGDFTLVGLDGKPVTNQDLMGRWTLLYFGFTKCPDVCPEEMDKVTNVLCKLDAKGVHVQPVFITIDPDRDTPQRLGSYFENSSFHERFLPLTGSHDQVCKRFRCQAAPWNVLCIHARMKPQSSSLPAALMP